MCGLPEPTVNPELNFRVKWYLSEMRIGQLADSIGMTTEAIRYYEKVGLLASPERTDAGYRIYNSATLERLRFIRSAQTVGFTLGEIGEILALRDNGETPCNHVRGLIASHAADLERRIQDLRIMQLDLQRLAEVAASEPEPGHQASHCHILESVN